MFESPNVQTEILVNVDWIEMVVRDCFEKDFDIQKCGNCELVNKL
jgi:hypothetical protein